MISNKKQGLYMAALTLTAILLVVVLLASPGREAQAGMLNAQPGFTLMTAGTPGGGDEVLIVIDNSTSRMVMYRLANNTNLEVLAASELGNMFRGARPAPRGGR